MRYVQIDPEITGSQQVIRLIETGEEPVEPGHIDVTDRPEAWYDVQADDFVDAPAPAAPKPLTAEQVTMLRRAAYAAESDLLKTEAEYDAMISNADPDYSEWLTAVAEIKLRFPLPVEN